MMVFQYVHLIQDWTLVPKFSKMCYEWDPFFISPLYVLVFLLSYTDNYNFWTRRCALQDIPICPLQAGFDGHIGITTYIIMQSGYSFCAICLYIYSTSRNPIKKIINNDFKEYFFMTNSMIYGWSYWDILVVWHQMILEILPNCQYI